MILAAATSLAAQRPPSAVYDTEREIRVEGAVTPIEWANPGAFVFLDVREPSGIVVNRAVDVGNPLALERQKWKRTAVRVGDIITVEASPARGAMRQALAKTVVHKASGKRLVHHLHRPACQRAAHTGAALA